MATYRRSRTGLQTSSASNPSVRPSGPIRHAVPKFVGEMEGINPMAGDMSGAFNRFFGQLNAAAQTVSDANYEAEKRRQLDINRVAKVEAVAAAQRTFEDPANLGKSPNVLLGLSPNQFTYDGETIQTADRRSYSETYSKAIGSLTGTRAWTSFADELSKKQVTPENAEAAATAFWTKNFGNGTGNAFHDAAAQKVWTDNVQEWRHTNRQAINKRAIEKLRTVTNRNIIQRFQTSDWGWMEYHESISDTQKAYPHFTIGQAASHVISQMKSAAIRSPQAAARMSAFLHEKLVDTSSGDESPSLVERFPNESGKWLAELRDGAAKYITIKGAEAVAAASSRLGVVKAMPDNTAAEMKTKEVALVEMGLRVNKLKQTPGTSTSLVRKLQSELAAEVTKLASAQTGVNRVIASTSGRNVPPPKDASRKTSSAEKVANAVVGKPANNGRDYQSKEEKDKAWTRILSGVDILNDENHAKNIASRARSYYQANGGYLAPELVTRLQQGLHSNDPKQVTNIMSMLGVIDPERNFFAAEYLKKDPMAAVKYEMYLAPGANIKGTIDLFNSENFRAAMQGVNLDQIVFGDDEIKKGEIDARYETHFFGDHGGGESIAENVLGEDWWFSTPTLAPEVRRYAKAIAKIEVAKNMASGLGVPTLEELKIRVGNYLRGITVPGENDMITFQRDFDFEYGSTGEHGRIKVNYGQAVVNPEGKVENTVKNVSDAISEIMGTGIIGLARKDYSTDWDLFTVRAHGIEGPARMIHDRKTGGPVILPVGVEFETTNLYSKKGERYSYWNEWKPWGEARDEQDIKFTGDPAKDKVMAARFLHPSIALHAERDQSGKVIGYRMSIMPYYKDLSDKYLDREALIDLMKSKGPLVEKRNLSKFQRKLLDPSVPESTKITSMGML